MYKVHTKTIDLKTGREQLVNIAGEVEATVRESGVENGLCVVFCPHTTAGITVNENADPDVVRDMLFQLGESFPQRAEFRHFEGNSPAHLKASFVGCQQTFIVEKGRLILGQWQGIYFCEFDGPRSRRVSISVQGTTDGV